MTLDACTSFAPVALPDAQILILGSMPGDESLRQQQYYAFRHNVFWRVMGEIYHFDPALPYLERLHALGQNKIALWDVLSGCRRTGSLDAMIRDAVPNEIPALLQRCSGIRKICCNGTTAGKYLKRFYPELPAEVVTLPSTSPAAALYTYQTKLQAWRIALTH